MSFNRPLAQVNQSISFVFAAHPSEIHFIDSERQQASNLIAFNTSAQISAQKKRAKL